MSFLVRDNDLFMRYNKYHGWYWLGDEWNNQIGNHGVALNIPQYMMTSSNGNIFRVTDPLCGEVIGHRWIPPTKASDAELWCFFFDFALNKRLSKQSWSWWFETPSRLSWRHSSNSKFSTRNDLRLELLFSESWQKGRQLMYNTSSSRYY